MHRTNSNKQQSEKIDTFRLNILNILHCRN